MMLSFDGWRGPLKEDVRYDGAGDKRL